MSVGAIALKIPVSRPAVSQHLKVLKVAGLVIDHPNGTKRIYEIDPDGLDAIHAYFERFWNNALSGFKRAAEQAASQEEQ